MNKSLEQYMPDGSKLPYRFMKYRIHKILLVCCSYDGYILEEDGHIERSEEHTSELQSHA